MVSYCRLVYGDGQSRICGRSDHCAWPEVTWPEVTSVTWEEMALPESMLCACATGSWAISALVESFDRKWQSRDRKWPWPEVCSAHVRIFPRVFFLVVVTWLPDVTQGHLTPLGLPWVCACATGSCTTPVMTEGHVTPSEVSMGCSLRRPRPIILGNPASYI